MSLATERASIVGILQGVSGIGKVHDYFRHVTKPADITDAFVKNGKLHYWCVSGAPKERWTTQRFPARHEHSTHRWEIHGFLAVVDKDATEKAFDDLVEAIFAAFRAKKRLEDDTNVPTVIESGPLVWVEGGGPEAWRSVAGPATDGGVLCHYARLALPVIVQTEP